MCVAVQAQVALPFIPSDTASALDEAATRSLIQTFTPKQRGSSGRWKPWLRLPLWMDDFGLSSNIPRGRAAVQEKTMNKT